MTDDIITMTTLELIFLRLKNKGRSEVLVEDVLKEIEDMRRERKEASRR